MVTPILFFGCFVVAIDRHIQQNIYSNFEKVFIDLQSSDFVEVDTSVRSPRKLFIFIIKRNGNMIIGSSYKYSI